MQIIHIKRSVCGREDHQARLETQVTHIGNALMIWYKSEGQTYDSGSESFEVMRLPSPSPRVLRLGLSVGIGAAPGGTCTSMLRPRFLSSSACALSASSLLFFFFFTRPGTNLERLLGPAGRPSSRLVCRLPRVRSTNESTEFRMPPRSISVSVSLNELAGDSPVRAIRAFARLPLKAFEEADGAGEGSLLDSILGSDE